MMMSARLWEMILLCFWKSILLNCYLLEFRMRKVQKDLLTNYNKTLLGAKEEKYFMLFEKKDKFPKITRSILVAPANKSASDFHHWLTTVTNALEMSACPSFHRSLSWTGVYRKTGKLHSWGLTQHMNALCSWHRPKQLTFDSGNKDTETFTGMSSLNSVKTYAQVFLCADEEQLNGGGVVLFQGVFQPLPAEAKRRL